MAKAHENKSEETSNVKKKTLTICVLDCLEAFFTQDVVDIDEFGVTGIGHSVVADENDIDDI